MWKWTKGQEESYGDTELTRVESFLFSVFMFADFGVGGGLLRGKAGKQEKTDLKKGHSIEAERSLKYHIAFFFFFLLLQWSPSYTP